MEKVFGRAPFRTTRFDQRHAKHAIALERVFEHLAVAGFENVSGSNACGNSTAPGNGITGTSSGKSTDPFFTFDFRPWSNFTAEARNATGRSAIVLRLGIGE